MDSRLVSLGELQTLNVTLLVVFLVCFVGCFFKPFFPFALAFVVYVLFLAYRFGVSEESTSPMLGVTVLLAGSLFMGAKSAVEEKAAAARNATSEVPKS